MRSKKTAVLLLNIGSPDSYKVSAVRRYLHQFLFDGRVIELPAFFRFLLVYGIIVPFRAFASAKKYKEIWTIEGSPLMVYSEQFKQKLAGVLEQKADVFLAMRYGNPSIPMVLEQMKKKHYTELIVCPMYPHNASSTTGSSVQKVFSILEHWVNIPAVKVVDTFWDHPMYLQSMIENARQYQPETYDHVIISFHGLPLKQVYRSHGGKTCADLNCVAEINDENYYCYQSSCYRTAEAIAKGLNLSGNDYTIAFQSRLSKNWLEPFTDDVLEDLVKQDKKKVMVICPSFVADCLETIHEIEIEYGEIFKKNGGEKLFLVPALNSNDAWVERFSNLIFE
ncbi:MAG: ferrochelatase [Salinivirgaceae bacterium]